MEGKIRGDEKEVMMSNVASIVSVFFRFFEVFKPETFCTPRGIIPQNVSSLGLPVLEELANKQTNKQTHRQTHGHPIVLYLIIVKNVNNIF